MKSFVAAYPPPTLFGYIDATSLAEGRAKEVSILASALKTVLKSPAAAVTNDALAPMLRAGMAHASGAVRALCVEVLRDRTVEDDALRSLLLLRGSDDDSLLGDVVRAVRDEETAVAEGSVRVLLRLSAAPEAAAARARVAAQLIARATARGAATPSASAVAPSVASARCVDLAVRMTCASAEAFAALEPLGALGALADAVSRGGDVLAQLGALELVERVVAPNAYASLHAVARSADGGALLAQLLRICEDVAGAGGEKYALGTRKGFANFVKNWNRVAANGHGRETCLGEAYYSKTGNTQLKFQNVGGQLDSWFGGGYFMKAKEAAAGRHEGKTVSGGFDAGSGGGDFYLGTGELREHKQEGSTLSKARAKVVSEKDRPRTAAGEELSEAHTSGGEK